MAQRKNWLPVLVGFTALIIVAGVFYLMAHRATIVSSPVNQLDPAYQAYVKTWHGHGANLIIRADHTATLLVNTRCPQDASKACQRIIDLKLGNVDHGITAMVTSNSDIANSELKVGTQLRLVRSQYVIQLVYADGEGYVCDQEALDRNQVPDSDKSFCGI